jgi:hypothetical protein
MNPAHVVETLFCKTRFNIILPLSQNVSGVSFLSVFLEMLSITAVRMLLGAIIKLGALQNARHFLTCSATISFSGQTQSKGKATPAQAWIGAEGSRKLRLPDFNKTDTRRW